MKSEWKKCKLSSVTEIISGGTPKTNVKEYWNGSIPWLSVKDFNNGKKYVYSTEKTITDLGFQNSATNFLQEGDIIISARGTVGEMAMIPFQMAFNQSCYGLRARRKIIETEFLYYLLRRYLNVLKSQTHGTVFDTITRNSFENIEITLPPLPTQKKIAAILSALDAKIENNNAINRNLEQQAQAIFKSWFVDFEPFGGKMPEGWRVGKLEDMAYVTMGQSPNGKSYNTEHKGMVFYQGRAEFGYRFPIRNLFTTEPKRLAEKYDVLMSVRAPVGDLNIANEQCCIGRGLCAIHSKDSHQSFVLYTLQNLKKQLKQFDGEGTVFGSINKDSVKSLNVVLPQKEYLDEFENFVSKVDKAIFLNCEENTRLAALRDTLLPKLMSGEIEV